LDSTGPVDAHEAPELKMADDLREMCMEWSVKTPDGRLIDGPDIAKLCKDFFEHRSYAQKREDEAEWPSRVESARQEWARVRMETGEIMGPQR